tara:strand:+ start:376 stop:591 length:216 start_codon:yes stop_codon:yes gene_type:complete
MKRDKTTRSEQWVRNIVIEVLLYNKTLTLNEACKYLNKDRLTIIRAIKNKQIFATRVGTHYVIPQTQFLGQ